MKTASAIVANRGGRTCHASIIARELGIPAVVGTGNGTDVLTEGSLVTVSCADGEKGQVYKGLLPFVAAQLPNSGVGLARCSNSTASTRPCKARSARISRAMPARWTFMSTSSPKASPQSLRRFTLGR